MNGETISRAQVLLQYYSALAELEEEGRLTAPRAVLAGHALSAGVMERIGWPLVVEKELRAAV